MKYFPVLILAICVSCIGSSKDTASVTIIPRPDSVVETGRLLKLSHETTIFCADVNLAPVVEVFSGQIKDYISLKKADKETAVIQIRIISDKKPEAYSLMVVKGKIIISASTSKGVFYGLQSLRQLIIFSEKKDNNLLLPCCFIDDAPRYGWRGLMLDDSRHFFGVDKVKQLLDMMALHKLNTFHWHLTDCAGWRLEIKKYPLLSTIGGKGNDNDPEAPVKYYTQEQIKEIVKYAEERFIQIVPEIDMPGHAAASNRAYPEFSGGGSKQYPEFTFNPGKEGTYSYLTNILREVTDLFPSPYIHLGGDEVHFGNQQWNTNHQVKLLMKKQNLPDLKAVEKYFVKRMADTIRSLGKITVGWDEIIDLKINPENAVVMWWRHDKPEQLKTALESNYKVVLCPRIPLYFDFVQHGTHKWGRRWKGAFCELETVYNFPPDTLPGFKEFTSGVLGIQANVWTEIIPNGKRLDFMTYPRLCALAEAAWTNGEDKDYQNFLIRLKPLLNFLKSQNIYYYNPFDPDLNSEPAGN